MPTKLLLNKPTTTSPEVFEGNNNKHSVVNKILRGLPRKEYKAVFPQLELVDLPVHRSDCRLMVA